MPHLLVIHRKPSVQRSVMALLQMQNGWEAEAFASATPALDHLQQTPADLLIVELALAVENDLALLKTFVTADPRRPVLLTGGDGTVNQVVACLEAGAAGFVHNARLASELVENARRVLAAANRDRCQARLLGCMTSSSSTFALENDPTLIPALLGRFQTSVGMFNLCDAASRARVGMALEEAITNALYHGNLELSSDLRREGIDAYYALAAERRGQAPYRDRRVYITERIDAELAVFTIRDEGRGFDVTKLNAEPDPEDLEAASGRGIMLMQAFMDEVNYNATGNEVTMVKRCASTGMTLAA